MSNEDRDSPLLSVTMEDRNSLRAAYMPFIVNGGLFIPTPRPYSLGEEVFVVLRLMQDPRGLPLAGRVVWITPSGALGGKPPGIGVQFADHDHVVRNRIAACLADHPDETGETYTL